MSSNEALFINLDDILNNYNESRLRLDSDIYVKEITCRVFVCSLFWFEVEFLYYKIW